MFVKIAIHEVIYDDASYGGIRDFYRMSSGGKFVQTNYFGEWGVSALIIYKY